MVSSKYRILLDYVFDAIIFMAHCQTFKYERCPIARPAAADRDGMLRGHTRLGYQAILPEVCREPEVEWDRKIIFKNVHDAVGRLTAREQRLLAVYLDPGSGRLCDKYRILGIPSSTMSFQYGRLLGRLYTMIRKDW
jgi:hypothetical protein